MGNRDNWRARSRRDRDRQSSRGEDQSIRKQRLLQGGLVLAGIGLFAGGILIALLGGFPALPSINDTATPQSTPSAVPTETSTPPPATEEPADPSTDISNPSDPSTVAPTTTTAPTTESTPPPTENPPPTTATEAEPTPPQTTTTEAEPTPPETTTEAEPTPTQTTPPDPITPPGLETDNESEG